MSSAVLAEINCCYEAEPPSAVIIIGHSCHLGFVWVFQNKKVKEKGLLKKHLPGLLSLTQPYCMPWLLISFFLSRNFFWH